MSKSTGGVSFLGLLAVAFIVLKLAGQVDWSWWWVLAPIWGPALLSMGGVIVFLAIHWSLINDDDKSRRDW